MPKPNPNFIISLGVAIIILLDLTQPWHHNIKILQASFLAPNPSFVMESLLCLHMLVRHNMTLKVGWLARWLDEICILCYIGLNLFYMDLLKPNFTTLNGFPLITTHNLPMPQTKRKKEKTHLKKKKPYFNPLVD
jgi:hypothetical protein